MAKNREIPKEEILSDLISHPGWHIVLENAAKEIASAKQRLVSIAYGTPEAAAEASKLAGKVQGFQWQIRQIYTQAGVTVPERVKTLLE